MTIAVNISDAAKAHADALVLSGRYGSIEQAVEKGLAEADAGEGESAEIVFERLIARYGETIRREHMAAL